MKKYLLVILISISTFFLGCEKWLDVNHDPIKPSTADIDKLLPGIYYDVATHFSLNYDHLGYVCEVYVHRLTTREAYDQYGVNGSSYAIDNSWSGLYTGPIQDLELLITTATRDSDFIYRGIGKIMKAYVYSQVVDLWGNVPFSEATMKDYYTPVFDKDHDIYVQIFTLLNEGIADLTAKAPNIRKPGTDDLVYGGNIKKWKKAANTIKLKLYNQVKSTDLYNQTDVNSILSDQTNNLIGIADDFIIPFGSSDAPDDRNPAFVEEYSGSQISDYISPWFYETMTGENNYMLTFGFVDPRIPYYFANQLDANNNSPETTPEYKNGYMVSVYFGSVGSHRDGAGRNTFTMVGLYPCGGAYDLDPTLDKSKSLGVGAGKGAAPYRLITYADVLYLKAEMSLGGLISGDPEKLVRSGMYESFNLVNKVVGWNGDKTIPLIDTTADEVKNYIKGMMKVYSDGDNTRKLETIITQKWISSFGTSIDAYSDYRRTGFPKIFDPKTMADFATGGPDGSGKVPVQLTRGYPWSFPYSSDELSLNSKAPAPKADITVDNAKLFWNK